MYDDADFRRQLRDAAASLAVGSAWELASRVTPLTQPPGAALRRALTVLDEGEEWLLEPRRIGGQPAALVARHQARRAARLVLPPHGVLRPRAGAHARRGPRRGHRARQRHRRSASPAGSRRWTIARSRAGSTAIEAGNLYVNRPITGAIVGRQPFGGWKASSVGPGAKAGGPNYVLQLARWRQVTAAHRRRRVRCAEPVAELLARCLAELAATRTRARCSRRARRATRARGAQHFSREHDPSAILGERNVFRYRPCRRVIVARRTRGAPRSRQVVLAACVAGTPLTVSLAPDSRRGPWLAELRSEWSSWWRPKRVRGAAGASGGRRARARLGADLDARPARPPTAPASR